MRTVLVLGGHDYVGSALLAHLRRAGLCVESVDLDVRGNPGGLAGEKRAFQDLTRDELSRFESIVLLAGHSSVADCDRAPTAAFANNVSGFVELVHKLQGQQLIFASSMSVYVNTNGRRASESDNLPEPVSAYDFHKQSIERYAQLSYSNWYAMRFGTVCGPSPALRRELLLNSLVWSAIRESHLRVANPVCHRALLGVFDLCRAIEMVIRNTVPPGAYNLASENVQIGELADYLADRYHVPWVDAAQTTKYDLQATTQKFSEKAGFEFQDTVETLVSALEESYVQKVQRSAVSVV